MAKVAYTAATLAAELEVAPKALRVFLRTPDSGIPAVGKGGRYSIEMTATQLAKFKKNFTAWTDAKEEARAAREAEIAAAQLAAPPTAEVAELDMTNTDEPNAADLDDDAFAEMLDEIANEDEADEVEA